MVLTFFSCAKDSAESELLQDSYQCQVVSVQNNYSRNGLIQTFDAGILQGLASIDIPDDSGAMGRNKSGYFHVRFQMGISGQADYAIHDENTQYLENAVKAIEYAFDHQLADGNFELIVPQDLSDQIPSEADLASGVSFFLSSLGLALNNFDESDWYNAPSNRSYKDRIENLRPHIEKAANWLLTKQEILEIADQDAPNRLLFNALAFYSLGKWTGQSALRAAGLSFANTAISKKHPNGYFIEGNGWDSSYQGVAISVGFNLYSLLPGTEALKSNLWNCLSCAANWQKSRVLESGEISLQGNTRVYPGGESFLGQEKAIDWIDAMVGFFMMGYYVNDSSYIAKANRIKGFYH